ncbi:MAG: hypothetical protein QG635_91 [Bacteroidota bacterium]|nr:hypothetical protein [Bacteroidota bacterium]
MPIQAPFAKGIKGEIMIFDEYKIGWLEQNIEKAAYLQSDNRFISNDKGNKNE